MTTTGRESGGSPDPFEDDPPISGSELILGYRGERRYRVGERRTSAEPLVAAWQPDEYPPTRARARKRPRQGLLARYGWRVYAIPVLLVLTVVVGINTAKRGDQGGSAPLLGGNAAAAPESAVVSEQPPVDVNLNIPTAELPDGGQYTQSGVGTWRIVPGNGKKAGAGAKLFTYTVEVEDGIDPAQYGGDDAFAKLVEDTLSDPRSWIGGGQVAFQRVDGTTTKPSFRVSLTTPTTDHRPDMCDLSIKYETSCYRKSAGRVVINLARWVRGALAFGGDMGSYRQYAINHEVGHFLGNGHVGCATDGALAPVMMQQTFGVADDYVAQLNQVDPLNKQSVQADAKTCKPNAWPMPQTAPASH